MHQDHFGNALNYRIALRWEHLSNLWRTFDLRPSVGIWLINKWIAVLLKKKKGCAPSYPIAKVSINLSVVTFEKVLIYR